MRCCVSLRGVCSEAHAVHALNGLQFHSGIAQNTVGHFELTAHPISFGHPRASQGHRKYQIEGWPPDVWTFSLPTSRRSDDAHDVLILCVDPKRLSVEEAAVFFEERRFVSAVSSLFFDDQVRTLQQDVRTQPSLQRRRFPCDALCAHRGFRGSTRGGIVGWSCAAMPGCECHSQHPACCAHNRSSRCVNVEAIFGPQIEHAGFEQ